MVHIPVAMATDNNYIPLVVSLISLIKSAEETTFYDIYILVDEFFTKESEMAVESALCAFEERCRIRFKKVGHYFDDAFIGISHITRPTYYRLMLPELLNEDRCIYLDTDTIILSDLQNLFGTSLDNYYIAGVWHPGIIFYRWEEAVCRNARIPDASQYVNAGILVMNLSTMRRDKVVERFMDAIPLNMPSQDQDIINHVCYGKIALLPLKYNVITKLSDKSIENYKGSYTRMELLEAWNRPCIIHYADINKPWNSGKSVFMEHWWKFFGSCSIDGVDIPLFFQEFIIDIIYSLPNGDMFSKKLPKIFNLKFRRNYVIYGAGKRAKDVISYLKRMEIIPMFIIVSNREGNPSEIEGIKVQDVEDVSEMLHDKSIIVAVREELQKEIIRNLWHYDYFEILPILDEWRENDS